MSALLDQMAHQRAQLQSVAFNAQLESVAFNARQDLQTVMEVLPTDVSALLYRTAQQRARLGHVLFNVPQDLQTVMEVLPTDVRSTSLLIEITVAVVETL